MLNRLAWLAAALVFSVAGLAQAQAAAPLAADLPARFKSWQPSAPVDRGLNPAVGHVAASSPQRRHHALIGGAIGALTGVAFCTVVASLVDDSDSGLSTCPADTLLLFGAGGFALGFGIGWII